MDLVLKLKNLRRIDINYSVTLAYKDPKGDQPSKVVEDIFGNDLDSFSGYGVDCRYPSPDKILISTDFRPHFQSCSIKNGLKTAGALARPITYRNWVFYCFAVSTRLTYFLQHPHHSASELA